MSHGVKSVCYIISIQLFLQEQLETSRESVVYHNMLPNQPSSLNPEQQIIQKMDLMMEELGQIRDEIASVKSSLGEMESPIRNKKAKFENKSTAAPIGVLPDTSPIRSLSINNFLSEPPTFNLPAMIDSTDNENEPMN